MWPSKSIQWAATSTRHTYVPLATLVVIVIGALNMLADSHVGRIAKDID
jgi:hypothetical protein